IIVQAYVAWQVQGDADNVQRFMRAVQNQPDEAARQIRTFVGSALETTARQQIDQQLLATYGVRVLQVGVERLTLPSVTLNATVDRMRA
ncbi:SPFH domain-containing protein, partial [Pseudomonas syringae pv. actinidiae ICMP 18804]